MVYTALFADSVDGIHPVPTDSVGRLDPARAGESYLVKTPTAG
jgi:hypothetical protein